MEEIIRRCIEQGFVSSREANSLRRFAESRGDDVKALVERIIKRGVLLYGDIELLRYFSAKQE
jgi:hypothetical protein